MNRLRRYLSGDEDYEREELARAAQNLLDRVEDVRAQRLAAMHPRVTEAMLDVRVALDNF
jgi:hypothetical protein